MKRANILWIMLTVYVTEEEKMVLLLCPISQCLRVRFVSIIQFGG